MSDQAALPTVAVVLPAAGRGVRMGGKRKQFRKLGDRPLLLRTLEVFDNHDAVSQAIVVAPPDDVDLVFELLTAQNLRLTPQVIAGGESRSESVRRGLAAVDAIVDVVLVHDAVRPFVSAKQVDAVVQAAVIHGAASLAVPVVDTLRQGREGVFGDVVERDGVYRVQTPQAFRRAILDRAHAEAGGVSNAATDDATLVMQLGHPVQIVPGSNLNFKITTEEDWELACMIWRAWKQKRTEEA